MSLSRCLLESQCEVGTGIRPISSHHARKHTKLAAEEQKEMESDHTGSARHKNGKAAYSIEGLLLGEDEKETLHVANWGSGPGLGKRSPRHLFREKVLLFPMLEALAQLQQSLCVCQQSHTSHPPWISQSVL